MSDVKVFEPDKSLQAKVGGSISKVLSGKAVEAAEKVVENSAGEILKLVSLEIEKIRAVPASVNEAVEKKVPVPKAEVDKLIASAFFIKSNAGLCGYQLVSEMAKSLYLFVETRNSAIAINEQEFEIIAWHIEAIAELIKQKQQSVETDFGKELLKQLAVIKSQFVG